MISVAGRVEILLREHDQVGRPLVFVETDPSGAVHVVGPDEDQPEYTGVADYLLSRRFRVVCGRVVSLTALEGLLGVFEDVRICQPCRQAFGENAWLIFQDNTEHVQNGAPGLIASIQRSKAMAADRAALTSGSSASGGDSDV